MMQILWLRTWFEADLFLLPSLPPADINDWLASPQQSRQLAWTTLKWVAHGRVMPVFSVTCRIANNFRLLKGGAGTAFYSGPSDCRKGRPYQSSAGCGTKGREVRYRSTGRMPGLQARETGQRSGRAPEPQVKKDSMKPSACLLWVLVAALVPLPGRKGRDRVITFKEEQIRLRAASATLRDLAILAVDTGPRPDSELFHWNGGTCILSARRMRRTGTSTSRRPKASMPVRNIPLTSRGGAVLEMRAAAANGKRYVFPGDGKAGQVVSLQHPQEKAIRKAKLAPFEFCCWRHTFGTRAAESGMDKFSLARLMGWLVADGQALLHPRDRAARHGRLRVIR